MKSLINEHYLKEAKRIRQNYFKHLEKINSKSELINKHKDELENILKEVEVLQKRAENDQDFQKMMNEQLNLIEAKIESIQQEIRPDYEAIKELRQDSSNLYSSIIEKYPDLSVDDIKIQIIDFINLDK